MTLLQEFIDKIISEELLQEATVRDHRIIYQLNSKKAPKWIIKNIIQALLDMAPSVPDDIRAEIDADPRKFLKDRIVFNQNLVTPTQAKFTVVWAPKGYDLENVKDSNKSGMPMFDNLTIPLFSFSQPYEIESTVGWLTTKEEELRCEADELASIRNIFKENGISIDKPATIVVVSTQTGNQLKFDNVVDIVKSPSKTAVADFILIDNAGQEIPGSGISHKCLGFERFAAFKAMLKSLNDTPELKAEILAIEKKINGRWINDTLNNQEESAYWHPIQHVDLPRLLYGTDAKMLAVSARGGLRLAKVGDNIFGLSATGTGEGGPELLVYPEVPEADQYQPIVKIRYGKGGSKLKLDGEDINAIAHKLASGQAVSKRIKMETDDMTDPPLITSAHIPLRYYIAPKRRAAGLNVADEQEKK
jgi:hypothetical protein